MRYGFVTIFLVSLLALSACQNDARTRKETLVIGVESYPKTLDPRLAVDALSSKICRLVYRGLFALNDQLQIELDVAESYVWESTTRLRVKLKKGIQFHNGQILTAKDVLATNQSVLDRLKHSPLHASLSLIQKMEAPDEYTLLFELKEPYAPFLTSLTSGILPASIVAQEVSSDVSSELFEPIGSGPFFVSRRMESQEVELTRYKPDDIKVNKLVFRTILEDTLRTMELIKGRLDLVQNAVPYQLLPAIQKAKNLNLTTTAGINFSYIGFNTRKTPLDKTLVRKALALAVNRDEIIKYKMSQLAAPASSMLFPGHWAAHENLPPFSYDPAQAKEMLDQAGYPDPDGDGPQSRFSLVYKTSSKKDRVDMALLIAEQMKKIGVEVIVKSYEWGTFFRDIRQGHFEMFSLTWVGLTEPDIYYWAFHSGQTPPTGANRGYYNNPSLDPLLEKARQEVDLTKRVAMYQEIQQMVYDDFPYIPLWYEQNWVIAQKNVNGYTARPDAGFQNLVHVFKTE